MTTVLSDSIGFPKELLEQPASERLSYFQHKVVAHPHLKAIHQALTKAIQQPSGASLVLVFGPTGVGKTTLRLRIEQQLAEEARNTKDYVPGNIPVASIEATSPETGDFRWKDYYMRALQALDDPFLDHRIDYRLKNARRNKDGQVIIGSNVPICDLRWAVEQALRLRHPKAFIVDEAQHLRKISGGKRLLDQMDILKSLANVTDTVHVLIGTYELLSLANLSAQLNRRSIDIHFPRYRCENNSDWIVFKSILLTFQRYLPLAKEPDLVEQGEYFYERSLGCVGILKDWLTRSLSVALDESSDTLSERQLESTAYSHRKLLRIIQETREGEDTLQEQTLHQSDLRMLLGMDHQAEEPADLRKTAKRVGERNPVRDRVGRSENAV
jgi:adenylate kinase family enzyme